MPKISIIIPCYNQENYISECLNSVVAQTFKDYEAIVIDDGSTDDSVEVIEKYTKKYENIRLIKQKNQGVIAARNNAIKQAKGKYIYPLDGDDIIAKTTLEKSYDAMESGKGDIISCIAAPFNKLCDISPQMKTSWTNNPSKYKMLVQCLICNSALYRKSDFEKCGGYDPAFKLGWEDYDFWLNMITNNELKIYRIPETLFYFRIKDISESRNMQANKFTKELNKLLLKKYPKIRYARLLDKFINIKRFVWQKKITSSNKLIIKICKIPVYNKQLNEEKYISNIALKISPAFSRNNLGIVLSADSNYVPYLAVTIKSIFENTDSKYNYDILIFDDGIKDYQKSLLADMCKDNCSIRYINVKELLKEIDTTLFQVKGIWSTATFYRLFIPKIMSYYDKILYLDCDILVRDSLVDLFNTDMKDKQIAGVPDYMTFSPKLAKVKKHMEEIGIKDYQKYFNAGVVLFRPNKIDYDQFKKKFLNILQNKKLAFLDQDILNIIFEGKTHLIDLKWNYQYNLLNDYPKLRNDKKLADAENNAKIIHYTTSYKPWSHPSYPHATKWWNTARQTTFYEEIIFNNTRTSNLLLRNLVRYKRLVCKFMVFKLLKIITFGKTNRKINKTYNDIKNQILGVRKVFR